MTSIIARALAASAAALVFAAASSAQDPSGVIGAGVSHTSLDNGVDDDFTGITVDGAYYNALTDSLNFQLNVAYSTYDTDPDSMDIWNGDVALFLRDPRSHAVGVFGSVLDYEAGEAWGGGAEGALFLDQWTVGGGAGVFDGEDVFDRLYGGCVYGLLYGSENFAIDGRVSLADVDYGTFSSNAYALGAGAEYQVMGSGFSLVGGVNHASLDDINLDATTWTLGGKLQLGTRSLKQRDREGAGARSSACIADAARF
jgi:hypothetical protein